LRINLIILLSIIAWLALQPARGWSAGLSLALGDATGHGMTLYDVKAVVDVDGTTGGSLAIGRAVLPAPVGELRAVRIECARLQLTTRQLRCEGGRLAGQREGLTLAGGELDLRIGFDGALEVRLHTLPVMAGEIDLDASYDTAGQLQARVAARALSLAALAGALAPDLGDELVLAGYVDLDATVHLGAAAQLGAGGQLRLTEVTAASADGRLASEGLGMTADWRIAGFVDAALQLDSTLAWQTGLVYVDPVFLDLEAGPLQATFGALLEGQRVTLNAVSLRDGEALQLDARGALDLDGSGWLAITSLQAQLPYAYERYLQPFLIGGPLDNLDTLGRLSGQGRIEAGQPVNAQLLLEGLEFRTQDDRLALQQFDAQVHWQREGASRDSWLRWRQGRLFDIDIGAVAMAFNLQGEQLRAPGSHRIPILDGALVLEDIEAVGLTRGLPDFRFDAQLEPVSLALLSEALGWPPLGGQLAGVLPGASYRQRVIATGGALAIDVFDGSVIIEDLRIEGLLSPLPRLTADIRIAGLDLEQLTGTFAFGQITGRLEGEILGLRLLDWRPSAFDARLATPADYRGPRRISQSAIDNLTAIGGGIAGGLAGGFMRFFDDFSYDRIGLSCRLRNEICLMDGVGEVNGGYYIVRGRGLPRMNLIGSVRVVSWPVLLRQLASIEQLEGPQVQ
jgi:hypothetical protein